MTRCPICEGAAAPRPDNPSFPFCSARCRLIDLGRWLDGKYRVPDPEPPPDAEPPDDDGDA